MTKTGPKGPRNKHKRVLLVEGCPKSLYEDHVDTYYSFKWKGREYQLGKCGEDIPTVLKEMNSYAQINSYEKHNPRCIKAPPGTGTTFRKVAGNTHIIIMADTEERLQEREELIKIFLSTKGQNFDKRCRWVCVIDDKYAKTAQKPTPMPAPEIQNNGQENIICEIRKTTVLFPMHCDTCLTKKICGTYKEMTEKLQKEKQPQSLPKKMNIRCRELETDIEFPGECEECTMMENCVQYKEVCRQITES